MEKYINASIFPIVAMVKKSKPKRSDITTIQISRETKAELDKHIKRKGETYDQIIKRLLNI